jgi:hypothetical protein
MGENLDSKPSRTKNKKLSNSKSLSKFMGTEVTTDLEGRLRNLPNFSNNALFPVFEAVVNSIQAIHERGSLDRGHIVIRIIREFGDQTLLSDQNETPEKEKTKIKDFEIEDDGIGFDKRNFDSFQKLDSLHKKEIGGKGIGRLYWLKAFDKIEVESIYLENTQYKLCKFSFTKKNWIKNENANSIIENETLKTIVKLKGFKEEYRKRQTAFKKIDTIAEHILKYCISYFMAGTAPHIIIEDKSERIDLDNVYSEQIQISSDVNFKVSSEAFKIFHTKINSKYIDSHKFVFCADNRIVQESSLQQDLGKSPFIDIDDPNRQFYYVGYISGNYLDSHLDNSRMMFYIPENEENLSNFIGELSMLKIRDKASEVSSSFLKDYITHLEKLKHDNVNRYLSKNPALLNIPEYCPELFKEIGADAPDDKIHAVLYKYKGIAELKIQKKAKKLLRTQADSKEEIKEKYNELLKEINSFDKFDLVKLLVWRKLILELLEKKVRLNSKNVYEKENVIHDIIFPRYTQNNKILFEDKNLWIFDESLMYHKFAASEPILNEISTSESNLRPDIICCEQAENDPRIKTVSIFEFKKPQKKDFDENPTRQIYRYIRDIQNQKLKTWDGRFINVDENMTIYYCYAICDINKQIKEFAIDDGFKPLMGSTGYYRYNDNRKAHLYIISFDKLIEDARKRHKTFFDKLGIEEPL